MLLLAFTSTEVQGDRIVYTYNAQGSCTSRICLKRRFQAKKVPKNSTIANFFKVELYPSPTFQDQLSISVMKLPSDHKLSYIMANASGQIVFNGFIRNGTITLTTQKLRNGIYIVKISGENFEMTYKLLKN